MSNPLTEARAALARSQAPPCGVEWTWTHADEDGTFTDAGVCDLTAGHAGPHGIDQDRGTVGAGHLFAALAEVDRLRAALDAIVRSHTAAGCLPACDTSRDIDADCTCGYIEACDPGDFAASVLAGEWSP